MKAQVMAYDGERAMFEAYGRNKFDSTGIIQWMMNNAWPSMIWHLYDYYLRPGGGYFGAKKACEPLHIQYSYDNRSIEVVNSFYREFKGLVASAEIYNLDMTKKLSKQAMVDIAPDGRQRRLPPARACRAELNLFRKAHAHGRVGQTSQLEFLLALDKSRHARRAQRRIELVLQADGTIRGFHGLEHAAARGPEDLGQIRTAWEGRHHPSDG